MASCQTKQVTSSAPYVQLTVSLESNTPTQAVIAYNLKYIANYEARTVVAKTYIVNIGGVQVKSGTFDINGKTGTHTICSGTKTITKTKSAQSISCSCSFAFNLNWGGYYVDTETASTAISVDALLKYTITYNANGGTGAPSAQTKWYNEELTLSYTSPTRTGYKFQGWGTSSTDSAANYQSGASYTSNKSITLYAIWKPNTYTVAYNANGGTGAPSAQTKEYGKSLTLTTAKPTRTDYIFKGWATSPTGFVSYPAGGTYTANTAITLYAVWELSYIPPKIFDVDVKWNSSYQPQIGADGATYQYVSCYWKWETTNADPNITVFIYDVGGTVVYNSEWDGTGNSSNGEYECIASEAALLRTDKSYTIQITIYDGAGSSTVTRTLTGEIYPIDILASGKGIAFGKAAETEGIADFSYTARFAGGIQNIVLLKSNDLNEVTIPNTYVSKNQGAPSYANCPISSGTFVLEVMSAGAEGQVFQRMTTTFKDGNHQVYERHFYQGSWGKWICVFAGDSDWFDLTLSSGISVGSELGYLHGRIKNMVLYIRGDVRGVSANWMLFAQFPSAWKSVAGLAASRFTGVYGVSNICSLSLQETGALYTTLSPTGSWDSTQDISINVAIAL